jgi:hypothetical protein
MLETACQKLLLWCAWKHVWQGGTCWVAALVASAEALAAFCNPSVALFVLQ